MGLHMFGVVIDRKRFALCGSVDDATFQEVTKDGLPPNWFAWHVEESECNEPVSSRVEAIRKVPQLPIRWQDALVDARAGREIGTTGYAVQAI